VPTRRAHPPSDGPDPTKLRRRSSDHQVSRAVYAGATNGSEAGSHIVIRRCLITVLMGTF